MIGQQSWYHFLCTLAARSERQSRHGDRGRGSAAIWARRPGSISLIWASEAAKTSCLCPLCHLGIDITLSATIDRRADKWTMNSFNGAPTEFEGGLNGICSRLGRGAIAGAMRRAAMRQFEGKPICLGSAVIQPYRCAVARKPRLPLATRAFAYPSTTTRSASRIGSGEEPRPRDLPRRSVSALFGNASRNALARGWAPPLTATRTLRMPLPALPITG